VVSDKYTHLNPGFYPGLEEMRAIVIAGAAEKHPSIKKVCA
jgi:hypothetical protein